MNRIPELFEKKKNDIFSVYFTAGYPALNDTLRIIRELDKAGVDMIEIGMPFSDPIADGPVIQKSSQKSLLNGMNLNLLFQQLSTVRKVTGMPLILMGYFNPVYRFGVERFLEKCAETGIDGTIIPDLPPEEYRKSYKKMFEKYGIINIFLISPETPDSRIRELDDDSAGFMYIISTSATTGAISKFNTSSLAYFRHIRDMKLKSPGLIGFGVSNHETLSQACKYADGAIAGSAFITALEGEGLMAEKVRRFTAEMRGAIG